MTGRTGPVAVLAALAALAMLDAPRAQPMPPPAERGDPVRPAPASAPAVPPASSVSDGIVSAPSAAADASQPVSLSAAFAGESRPIRAGLVWRIFEDHGAGATPTLVTRFTSPAPVANLKPGPYIVHAAYGLASTTRNITVAAAPLSERLMIAAGALKLAGAISDVPIPTERVAFSVFQPIANDSEAKLIAANVRTGDLVRLPEGTYHVVSTYGESNAIMRADLKVERGRITEATLNHRAATMTLKLVTAAGGEAFAGTAFSVLTPGGDVIREAIGAFPTVTLAEGDYVLIARHDGKVYTRDFKVESGLDRDVEVMVTPG